MRNDKSHNPERYNSRMTTASHNKDMRDASWLDVFSSILVGLVLWYCVCGWYVLALPEIPLF